MIDSLFECRSRLKIVVYGIVLFLLEAIVKAAWAAFPLVELYSAQGGLALAYLGAKSYTDSRLNGAAKPNIEGK